MESEYTTRALTKEEGDALTAEMIAVLEKYNAEMGVKSTIEILKRVPKDIVSPFMPKNDGNNDKTEESANPTPA